MSDLGQLIITGISGVELTEEEAKFIENENIGGIILFSKNYETPDQLAKLVNSIQVLRQEYPLFISVDNEGGRVLRFRENFSQIPAAFSLAKLNSPKIIFDMAKIQANEYLACGVNLNFAPVCDIWNNPDNEVIGDRAYGVNAEDVSKYVSAAIRGFQKHGILACAKHFPGHGNTLEDSHFTLPVLKKSLAELRLEEFLPFIKAIKSRVEFIMMAHLKVDDIDKDWPTTLSPKAYNILRKELQFKKLIITDDMEMKAITNEYSIGEAAVQAIKCGADILIYRSVEAAQEALEKLKEAKKTKKIKNAIIEEHLSRVLKCKNDYLGQFKPIYIPRVYEKINDQNARNLIANIQDQVQALEEK